MAGVALDASIDAEDPDPVEPVRIGDQDPLSLGQDRVVGGVPRHCQAVTQKWFWWVAELPFIGSGVQDPKLTETPDGICKHRGSGRGTRGAGAP